MILRDMLILELLNIETKLNQNDDITVLLVNQI